LGQRLHEDDLPGHLIRTGLFEHLNLPAIGLSDEKVEIGPGKVYHRTRGEALSARQSLQLLKEMRAEHGPAVFEAQYQQNPGASEAGLIQWHQIPTYDAPVPRGEMEQVVISWDTGNTPNPKSDYSVGTVWGFWSHKWHLLDVERGQWDFPTLAARVRAGVIRWRASRVLIEHCGSGISLVQQLLKEQREHAEWAKTGCLVRGPAPRLDKATRFTAVIEKLTSGRFLFPADAPWMAPLRREVLSFPDYCRNDDQVDSIVQFLEWISLNPEGQRLERGNRRPQGTPRRPVALRTRPLLPF
jgi:predicted phage terminase large subunit-like protein